MKHFEYIKWYIGHDKDLPAFIIYEIDLDNERYATRMANIFADRTVIPVIEEGFDFITEAPIPTIDEINQEKDYFAEIISKEEFEKIYYSEKYSGKLNTPPHSTLQTPHLKSETMKNIGLYIHVPFCVRKCRYCDFYSVTDLSLTDLYTSAVIRNIKAYGYGFDTVYFGGGTPSLLAPKQIGAILSAAGIATNAEISMECNPNSVTENYLREVRNAGVNRLSFGVQSFDDNELKMLGRLHDSAQAIEAIETAKKVGFDNISADLMLAVSGQTFESLGRSLDAVAKLPLTHISAYMLKVEEGTPLAADCELLKKIPDEDDTADMYLEAVKKLGEAGFEQYEISNFARDGFECKHNLKYWRCEEYLGIGPAAHSFIDGARFACPKDLGRFISSEIQETVTLDEGGSAEEKAMLALRLVKEGLSLEAYPESEKRAEMLIRNGLLKKEKGTLRLTPEGCLVSNQIICHLLT